MFYFIQENHLNRRIASAHRLAKFLGIKIRESPIQKKELPGATIQMQQSLRPSVGLLNSMNGGEALQDSLS